MRIPTYELIAQKVRAAKYPKDRICFLSSEAAAIADQKTFKEFQSGMITLRAACIKIAETNHLEEVTEEQFMNECLLLGYARHIKR